jgi:hypothetical protein
MNSGPLSIRSTFGGTRPVLAAPYRRTLDHRRAARRRTEEGIRRRRSRRSRLMPRRCCGRSIFQFDCTIDGKTITIASMIDEQTPARLRGLRILTWRPSSRQTMNLLLVDLTAFVVAQRRPRTPEPMARLFGGIRAQPCPHIGIGIGGGLRHWEAAAGGAGKPNSLARQPFRHTQGLLEHIDGAALGSWAQNFPVMMESGRRPEVVTPKFPGRSSAFQRTCRASERCPTTQKNSGFGAKGVT